MAWCRPGDKPLSEPMMLSLLTHNMRHSRSVSKEDDREIHPLLLLPNVVSMVLFRREYQILQCGLFTTFICKTFVS